MPGNTAPVRETAFDSDNGRPNLVRRSGRFQRIFHLVVRTFFAIGVFLLGVQYLAVYGLPWTIAIAPSSISPHTGYAYQGVEVRSPFDWLALPSDSNDSPSASHSSLLENGRPLGPPHTMHDEIGSFGQGRFSHWRSSVFFSASDNSDPRINGREYELQVRLFAPPIPLFVIFIFLLPLMAVVIAGVLLKVNRFFKPFAALILSINSLRTITVLAVMFVLLGLFGIELDTPISPVQIEENGGSLYRAVLDPPLPGLLIALTDSPGTGRSSQSRLLEEGRELGPPHIEHDTIRRLGQGRYSHWNDQIYFSTSDGSSPKVNNRKYILAVKYSFAPLWFIGLAAVWGALMLYHLFRIGKLQTTLALSVLVAGSALILPYCYGVAVWIVFGLIAVGSIHLLPLLFEAVLPQRAAAHIRRPLESVSLLVASLFFCLALFEGGVQLIQRLQIKLSADSKVGAGPDAQIASGAQPANPSGSVAPESGRDLNPAIDYISYAPAPPGVDVKIRRDALAEVESRKRQVSFPPEWERREVSVPGAAHAFYWHNALHEFNEIELRWTEPLPAKDPAKYRVLVVGDSLTYGYGIKRDWTYSAVLQQRLGDDYQVEVLNLGHNGFQSEDVAVFVKEIVSTHKPDRIVYGMCLNDFLPSGVEQRSSSLIPRSQFLFARTVIYPMLDFGLIQAAISFGFRPDFYGQIGEEIGTYSQRFSKDVTAISAVNTAAGLPPVIGIVLDQQPKKDAGFPLMQIAEKSMRDAGFTVVPAEPYYRTYEGKSFNVSKWEGHPNEVANAVFAALLEPAVRSDPALARFEKK